MRGQYLRLGGLGLLLVMLAVGAHQFASAQPRPAQPQPARTTAVNPHAGLTDAQRQAAIATVRAQTRALHAAWLQDFVQRGRDPRSLPRQPLSAFYDTPAKDLAAAVANADAIVVGTVRSTRFALIEADVMTFVTFAVERTLKGTVSNEMTIRQLGGPAPTRGQVGSPGILLYAENTPVLLAGDRAILFLQRAGTPDTYDVQNITGGYRIETGRVRAVDINPFRGAVSGQTEQEFIANVQRLVGN